ncbi:MAG: hypothetical protein PHT19_17410 [Methylococcus sp.]|nr:hypothetical protein [Methylococcus sp.]
MCAFTLSEAFTLMSRPVVLKTEAAAYRKTPQLNPPGRICGVLDLNGEIELVIRFSGELDLRQFTQAEFLNQVELIEAN